MSTARNPSRLTAEQAAQFRDGVAFAERFFMGLDEVHRAMEKLCATLRADGTALTKKNAYAYDAPAMSATLLVFR